jgi:16S rRNA (uracil1498-N3)-methyltransferase
MTRRRWIADTCTDATATLTGNQANHLFRVLRAEVGMEFDVLAGQRVWRAVITQSSEAAVEFRLLEEIVVAANLSLSVLMSVFKFDRMEWAIEKLTELGVANIEPILARRTEKHLAQAAANRVERWRRIALEAAKQSRRSALVSIAEPRSLREAIQQQREVGSLRLLLAEEETQQTLFGTLQSQTSSKERNILLAVGPEGGWTPEEQTLFTENAWTPVSLGSTILRAETAAIAAAAITSAWLTS